MYRALAFGHDALRGTIAVPGVLVRRFKEFCTSRRRIAGLARHLSTTTDIAHAVIA